MKEVSLCLLSDFGLGYCKTGWSLPLERVYYLVVKTGNLLTEPRL